MSCSSCLRAQYKQKVDNIYPAVPGDAPDKSALQQLTWYAVTHDRYLSKLGRYLASRIRRDLNRQHNDMALVGVQGMDQLLQFCHQNLNLFLEPFLSVVEALIERNDPSLQNHGVESFEKYANIEDQTPSYYRHFDFFVTRFSEMCYEKSNPETLKTQLAGLKGLRAIFKKTVDSRGTGNIWGQNNLDTIVPALLHNMEKAGDEDISTITVIPGSETPKALATECLRLYGERASFGNIRSLLSPVFKHFDNFGHWTTNFAAQTFSMLIKKISPQSTHVAIGELLAHLDERKEESLPVRTGIIKVLSVAVNAAAGSAIGPSVIEVFNILLNHLRSSAECDWANNADEVRFREAVIDGFGDLAQYLPDHQKVEVMIFIIGKVPTTRVDKSKVNLLICMQRIASTCSNSMALREKLPQSLFEPLLGLCRDDNAEVRELAWELCHRLFQIDYVEESSQAKQRDILYVREWATQIHWHGFESLLLPSNGMSTLRSVLKFVLTLATRFGLEEALDVIRVVIALQENEVTSVYIGFAAAFFKEFASTYKSMQLTATVDEALAPFPAAVSVARDLTSVALFPLLIEASPSQSAEVDKSEPPFSPANLSKPLQPIFGSLINVAEALATPYAHNVQPSEAAHGKARFRARSRATQLVRTDTPKAESVISFETIKSSIQSAKSEVANTAAKLDDRITYATERIWASAGPKELRAARFIELLDDHDFLVEDVSTPLLSPRTTWNVNLPSVFEQCH